MIREDVISKSFQYKNTNFRVPVPKDNKATVKETKSGVEAQISIKGGKYVIRVLNSDDNGQLYDPSRVDPIFAACDRILEFSPKSQEQLAKHLDDSFNNIEKSKRLRC